LAQPATLHLISVQGKYRNWAKGANFESKLPGDVRKRKAAAEEVTRTLDRDLREKKLTERVLPYTDKLFRQAATEWLVATDQVSVLGARNLPQLIYYFMG
jgi:hypothetical protein